MYKTELIKSQTANGIKNRVQAWLDDQSSQNARLKLISVSYTFEHDQGYRAFITYFD
ncbi:hypothetical protein [Acinetobacter halotolerans]|uniref:hypothetical protein n=1 Tax=Acinetobacter halotolerans TaxID=1752076 RepID=UPI0013EE5B59|nr:hypothetical protein [Acinetobacter halotolerans]